jgi:hypothetical protein
VGGILTALSLLAKKLISFNELNLQTPFIRMEWKPLSFLSSSQLTGLPSNTVKLSELRRFSPYATSVRSRMRLPATRSTRKREESNHPGMNTCTKIGGGVPPLSDGRPCLSRRAASTIFFRHMPREVGDPVRIAVPSDQRSEGFSPELPQFNVRSALARQSAAQIPAKERELERE